MHPSPTTRPRLRGARQRVVHGRDLARDVVREWRDDRLSSAAAEIAFFGLFSIFPGLLALAALLGSIDAVVGADLARRAEAETIGFLGRVLTDEAAPTIAAVEQLFERSSGGALTAGALVATWSMSRAMTAAIRGLDTAYDIDERRTWLGLRLHAFFLGLGTLVVGLVAMVVLIVGPLLGGGAQLADWLGVAGAFRAAWTWLRLPATVLVVTGWLTVLFHFAPFERTAWRGQLPGAVLTALWWVLASFALRAYLAVGGGTNQVLGALSGALSLVAWLYLLGLGLLVGGELNAVLAGRAGLEGRPPRHDVGRVLGDVASRALRWTRSTLSGRRR